ncbi:type II secretion system F family protein [Candidatus Saccharibacteria bacterium]|nr:type II secretion system F family protein [Candidatus Saccharibacteria bacterium]
MIPEAAAPHSPPAAVVPAAKPPAKRRWSFLRFNKSSRPPRVRADREAKEYIIESLSMMLSSGGTVAEALRSISVEIQSKAVKQALLQMSDRISEGQSLSAVMTQSGLFNQSVIALIKIGEDTGRLPENLSVIAGQMHKSNMMNAKIKSAMLYPSFLLGLLFLVGTGVGVFLLPRLLSVITSLQVEVGFMTKIIVIAGGFLGHYGLIMAALTVAAAIASGFLIRRNLRARIMAEAVIYHIPGIKKLLFESEVSRFGFILGTLLNSGLPVVTSLQSLSESMVTHRYKKLAEDLRARVELGESFAQAFDQPQYKKLLPSTIRQLITSAEKSGNLSETLLKVGQIYEDKADITARNLETLLEPIILVIIAVCVLFVALAVILPIYSLVGDVQ